jgi:hypothetical protein
VFAERLRSILGDDLLAVYLGGSFSTGDFVSGASDYDLLVLIAAELSPSQSERIVALHEELGRTEAEADLLEGDYVNVSVLVPEGTSRPAPWFRGGSLRAAEHMLSADNIANMRRHGVAVLGPPPASLLPDVGPELVRAAVKEMLAEDPDASTEHAAARELLDVARSLCALETGEPTSRAAGLRWAMRSMDARWRPALLRAAEVRNGAKVDLADETLRHALRELRGSLGLER